MNNFNIIVLDGVGIGELPDASNYGDEGSNTLVNIANKINGLELPNLEKMGLGNITEINGVNKTSSPIASYGKMAELSKGKDSTSGHWEIGGINVQFDFSYFPDGFTDEIIKAFIDKTGVKGVLGNKAASGTEIIKELGNEHVETGYPIVYTSVDSVFQIAAHEEVIPLDQLYEICRITREEILTDEIPMGRVIARPFIGENGNYTRTTNRKDYSLDPVSDTILDVLSKNGIKTIAVGKVSDLFNYRGIKTSVESKSNEEGIEKIIECNKVNSRSLIFTNLVDFDVNYGHRNDPEGFAEALKYFDKNLPRILQQLDETDALIITADHGNDPTIISTDHSREYVPLLFYQKNKEGKNLGTRKTFSDVAQTAAHYFKVNNALEGISFYEN
ncbi:MAG: phosphopentomutase [Ignavibacteriae bacterium]|nr:phosphopentomutase [Ignavibacteriota bacterium]NOG97603.1 phosphopentomutase [Ignavibacteriota bacterium]